MRFAVSIIVFYCFFSVKTSADGDLNIIRSIPMRARLMSVDEVGNVYVVRTDNSLVRFTANGDSSAFFRSVTNGDIGQVDATNPLSVVVYYPAYSRVVLLDRMLAQKNELDLRRMNIQNVNRVASSADGNLWVYDHFNARLRKVNDQLEQVAQSNDIRQETNVVPNASFLVERDWKVFLCDSAKGIFTFDRYGSYINTLSLYGVKKLQVFGAQLIYRKGDALYSWDMSRTSQQEMPVPLSETAIIDAAIVQKTLYVLYEDRLVLYRIPD